MNPETTISHNLISSFDRQLTDLSSVSIGEQSASRFVSPSPYVMDGLANSLPMTHHQQPILPSQSSEDYQSIDKSNTTPSYDEIFPALPENDKQFLPTTSHPVSSGLKPKPKTSNTCITQVFRVPPEERRYRELNSRFGEQAEQNKICKDIMQKTGAHIEMSVSKDGTLTFLITGKEEAVLQAKRSISSELQTQANVLLPIPKEHHRFILGKNGQKLAALEQSTGTKITVPRQLDTSDQIKVVGTKEAIDKAVHEIQLISSEAASRSVERVSIPKIYHPFISGPFGETVFKLSSETGAKINIPPPSVNKEEIFITGDRDAVLAAKDKILKIYEERQKKCSSVCMEVRKSQHKYIIGTKGQTLQEIFQKTGVSVEMPSSDSNSETITLRGEQDKLGQALKEIYEKAHSEVDTEIDVPSWLHKYILGPKGTKFHEISQDFLKVHVSFVTNEDKIKMHGPSAEVDKAKDTINNVIKEIQSKIVVEDFRVNPKYHRFIIGKNGVNIKHIREETGAQIHIPSENEQITGDCIKIEGSHESVAKAKKELEVLVRKLVDKENEVTKELIIEQRFHRQLIGTKGESIRVIRDRFNQVVIIFPDPGVKSDKVVIRGSKKDVEQCYKYLVQNNKELLENNFVAEVPIFKQFHKFIIGKEGANIKKIREETNTKIDLPAEVAESDVIKITGLKSQVELARERIQAIQNELANVVQVDIIVPAKFHNYIIGAKGRQIRQIMDECGGVIIKFPPENSGSDKVSIRGPKDCVQKAKQHLIALSNEQQVNNFSVELKAKPELHRYLIGKNGANIKKVREKTGARIFFPSEKEESPSDRESIVITGKKDDVMKTKQMLEEMIKEFEKIVESEMIVPAKYHRHFVSKRGEVLNKIKDEFGGVGISFPKNHDSEKVILKGYKECVENAKQKIKEIINDLDNQVTIECVIDPQYHRTIMGSQGTRVQGIQQQFDVKIKFPDRDRYDDSGFHNGDLNGNDDSSDKSSTKHRRRSDIIYVTGRKENCEKAKNALQAQIPITIEVEVPFDLHRFIIGQKGKEVKDMMYRYDVSIAVPPASDNSDVIKITGTKDSVERAKSAILEKVQKLNDEKQDRIAKSYQVSIRVNPNHHPKIIGKKGAVISKIREKYDVQIQFPELKKGHDDYNNEADADLITIIGYEKNANDAKNEILKLVDDLEQMVSEEVDIDSRVHPRLIGTRGKNIRKLMDQYSVDIRFPRSTDSNPNLVTIFGLPDNVDAAREHILNLAEEYLDDVIDQYTLPPSRMLEGVNNRPSGDSNKGFVVKGGPWEQTVPDTNDAQEFPSFGTPTATATATATATTTTQPSNEASSQVSPAEVPKNIPKWGPKSAM